MYDRIGAKGFNTFQDPLPISYVEFMVVKMFARCLQPLLVPPGVTAWAEKVRAHIVIDAVDLPSQRTKYITTSEPISPLEPVASNFFIV
jgi:hypothetical protein